MSEKIINVKRTKSKKSVELDELEDVLEETTNKIGKITIDNGKGKNKNDVWKHIFNEIKYNGEKEQVITAEEIKKCGKTWKGTNNQFGPLIKFL